jgi:two-component system LytT family response regulator
MSRSPARVLIVDDEELARDRVRELLGDQPDFQVLGECANGLEALEFIEGQPVDVLFLDIQMPGMDGFELLEELDPGARPRVVFITAWDRYALDAFRAHALDYLLKPFDADRFREMLDHVRGTLREAPGPDLRAQLEDLLAQLRRERSWIDRFVIRTGSRVILVSADDVDWIEAEGNYVTLHCGDQKWMQRETISTLEQRLDPARFCRIHRSAIVRLDRIRELQPASHGDYLVLLKNGRKLQMSRSYARRFKALG